MTKKKPKEESTPLITRTKAELYQVPDLSSELSTRCLEVASRLTEAYEGGMLDIVKDLDENAVCETLRFLKDAAVAHYSASGKELKKRREAGLPE